MQSIDADLVTKTARELLYLSRIRQAVDEADRRIESAANEGYNSCDVYHVPSGEIDHKLRYLFLPIGFSLLFMLSSFLFGRGIVGIVLGFIGIGFFFTTFFPLFLFGSNWALRHGLTEFSGGAKEVWEHLKLQGYKVEIYSYVPYEGYLRESKIYAYW